MTLAHIVVSMSSKPVTHVNALLVILKRMSKYEFLHCKSVKCFVVFSLGDFPMAQTKQEIISGLNLFAKLWRDNYPLSLHTGSAGECVTVALHVICCTGF